MFSRRGFIVGLAAAAAATPVRAAPLSYRGYRVDVSAVSARRLPGLETYLKSQIDLVEAAPMAEDSKAWLRTLPILINPKIRAPGRYGRGRVELKGGEKASDAPVLLHEAMHGWHEQRLPDGFANLEVLDAWEAAMARPYWEPEAYLYQNPGEFFAMTASVALHGQARRPPWSREELKEALPDWYARLADWFGIVA